MRREWFTSKASGRLVKNLQGHLAFIPNPLPPSIEWNESLAAALSAADSAVGKLSGMGEHWASRHLLTRTFTIREAVLSSRIEGTEADVSDVLLFQAEPSHPLRVDDVREVNNYVTALEYGLLAVTRRQLSLALIREMHELLMHGVRGHEKTPGHFRTIQNYIGKTGAKIEDARYVPPPPEHLLETLTHFESFLKSRSQIPLLIRLALIHYQFEAIHPFNDGNGRLGRMLIALLLSLNDALSRPFLYLSKYLERHREEYYDHLTAVSREGKWSEWIVFFLEGVNEQAKNAVVRAERLLKLRDQLREQVQLSNGSARLLELVDHLFAAPMITVPDAEKVMKVTRRAAQSAVDRLVELKILREITGRARDRVFEATKVVALVEDERA